MLPMIRKAIRKDIPAIYALVCELAEYERLRKEVYATVESYLEDFDNGWFNALVAESNGQIIGITIYYKTFSTWKGKMIYLEDFIVTESERGKGVGKLLFEAFLDESKRLGANLVRWQVIDWNTPAINFYKKYPTVFTDQWIDVKIVF